MRLNIHLVRRAPQFTNTLLQREIDLRGLRLSSLDENVLVLLDNNFDVINLTSNALTTLEYFPTASAANHQSLKMDRVVSLIVHRNEIRRLSTPSCVLALPNVQNFLADKNQIAAVRELCCLRYWKKLEVISLEENPIWDSNAENFSEEKIRAFLVFLCPKLKLINYERVLEADRELAKECKSEFKRLTESWDGIGAAASVDNVPGEGKKVRKRGREGRTAAASPSKTALLSDSSKGDGVSATSVVDNNGSEHAVLQARLDEIENRLMSDDIGADEMAQLEEEMTGISVKMESLKRRKRS